MFRWYTNGEQNIKIFDGEQIPEGFQQGFKFKKSTLTKKAREKKTKELDNKQIKALPLKERKKVYKQIEYDKIVLKEKREFLQKAHIPLINKLIRENLLRGLDYNQIFEIVKLKDGTHSQEFNLLLEDYILEQALIHQLSTMPNYLDTIYESLKDLYKKNPSLQHRKDLISYFLSIFD